MARVKNRSKVSDEIFDQYDKILETIPEIQLKGKANPYTSLMGHMFSFIGDGNRMCIRLSKEDQEAFVQKYKTETVMSHGSVMRGYVYLTDEMFQDPKKAAPYLKKSFDYIQSLGPKPSAKKR